MSDISEAVVAEMKRQAPPHYRIKNMLGDGAYVIHTGTAYVFKIFFDGDHISVLTFHEAITEGTEFASNTIALGDPDAIQKVCAVVIRDFAYYKVIEASNWYNTTRLGVECSSTEHCEKCEPSGSCEACDTIDGRYFPVVSEYVSTCDECCKPYLNEVQTVHPDDEDSSSPRAYCPNCYWKLFKTQHTRSVS